VKFVSIVSGTSTDGLSIANVELNGYNLGTKYKILTGRNKTFTLKLREELLKVAENTKIDAEFVSRLNSKLGKVISESVLSLDLDYDIISYSGHTVYHGPSVGKGRNGTLQLGEISFLVARSGKTAITDYRITDMAYGGLGAPLMALSDYIIFKKPSTLTVNIGGISNVTYLDSNRFIAFDTGPGNMLIDLAMFYLYGQTMDKNGQIALSGKVSTQLLEYLMRDPFFKKKPPKNSGREYFGSAYLQRIIRRFPSLKGGDLIRTLTRFTAVSIQEQVEKFIDGALSDIVVGGGGTKNPVLMQDLKELFNGKVRTFSSTGIRDDLREALGFAILANQTLHGAAGRLTDIQTMSGPVLGKIVPGRNFDEIFKLLM
jgi:anhydro-N-acetylmuramic acid kinase